MRRSPLSHAPPSPRPRWLRRRLIRESIPHCRKQVRLIARRRGPLQPRRPALLRQLQSSQLRRPPARVTDGLLLVAAPSGGVRQSNRGRRRLQRRLPRCRAQLRSTLAQYPECTLGGGTGLEPLVEQFAVALGCGLARCDAPKLLIITTEVHPESGTGLEAETAPRAKRAVVTWSGRREDD